MECVLVLNARHFGAKRKAKYRKIRDEKHKYPLQMVSTKPFLAMKHMARKGKIAVKSGVLGTKSA